MSDDAPKLAETDDGMLAWPSLELTLDEDFPAGDAVPVGFLGGLLAADGPLAGRVVESLSREVRLEILPGTLDPASGALAMSRRLARRA